MSIGNSYVTYVQVYVHTIKLAEEDAIIEQSQQDRLVDPPSRRPGHGPGQGPGRGTMHHELATSNTNCKQQSV